MSNGPPPSPEALLRMQQQEEEARKNAPKEMIEKRTKNSKKFVTPSGIYQTKTYPRAIHVKNDRGGWDEPGRKYLENRHLSTLSSTAGFDS
jgi:hypothetical protein